MYREIFDVALILRSVFNVQCSMNMLKLGFSPPVDSTNDVASSECPDHLTSSTDIQISWFSAPYELMMNIMLSSHLFAAVRQSICRPTANLSWCGNWFTSTAFICRNSWRQNGDKGFVDRFADTWCAYSRTEVVKFDDKSSVIRQLTAVRNSSDI